MDLLRVYLLAGMILHKAVWEALKRRSNFRPAPRKLLDLIKAVKIAALAGLIAQTLLPADVLPISSHPDFLRTIGALVFTAGLAIAVTARFQLGNNWADLEAATLLPGQQLVTRGIYRNIRHPIYFGDVLLVLGLELALNSWLVLFAAPLAAYVYLKTVQEERLLSGRLAGYGIYQGQAGRFLPRCAAVGVLAAAIAFLIQLYNVQLHYTGNWTAMFYTGAAKPLPPALRSESIYVFPNSTGYDSQFYHYMAHDPIMTRGLADSIDAPRLRYRRILLSAAAYVSALGKPAWIDPALLVLALTPYFLGAWWLARFAVLQGRSRFWGLGFLAVPASLISLDRLTVDLALAAFCCGFAAYAKEGKTPKLFAVLALATLARETGFLVLGAYGLYLLARREWRRAILFGLAGLPALAWFGYVQSRTPSFESHMAAPPSGSALLDRLFEPVSYAFPPLIAKTAQPLDYISLAAVFLAMALAARAVIRKPAPENAAAAVFAALPLVLGGIIGWYEPFGYPRTLSPLFLFVAMGAVASRSWLAAAPLALVLPRILMQLAPQFLGLRRFL